MLDLYEVRPSDSSQGYKAWAVFLVETDACASSLSAALLSDIPGHII